MLPRSDGEDALYDCSPSKKIKTEPIEETDANQLGVASLSNEVDYTFSIPHALALQTSECAEALLMPEMIQEGQESLDLGPNVELQRLCTKCNGAPRRWHCTICPDYFVCLTCYRREVPKHAHPVLLKHPGLDQCDRVLVHAGGCRKCHRKSCANMKSLFQHHRLCQRRQNGTCPVCKQYIELCVYHAKRCTSEACRVPLCSRLKAWFEERERLRSNPPKNTTTGEAAVPNPVPSPSLSVPPQQGPQQQ